MNMFLTGKLRAIRFERRDNYFQYLYNCANEQSPSEA